MAGQERFRDRDGARDRRRARSSANESGRSGRERLITAAIEAVAGLVFIGLGYIVAQATGAWLPGSVLELFGFYAIGHAAFVLAGRVPPPDPPARGDRPPRR